MKYKEHHVIKTLKLHIQLYQTSKFTLKSLKDLVKNIEDIKRKVEMNSSCNQNTYSKVESMNLNSISYEIIFYLIMILYV